MQQTFKLAALSAALTLAIGATLFGSASAHATTPKTTTYSAATIKSGKGTGATFSAIGGNLTLKNQYGVQGVGVTGGRTGDEIDIGESVVASFATAVRVKGFQLAFLYDGPEFGDVQEKAQVTVTFADLSKKAYTLTAMYPNTYAWTGLGTVTNPNPNTDVKGGLWTVTDPFGTQAVKSLSFTALQGVCGTRSSCPNQSDFGLSSIAVSPVPEPETYSLMLAGLAVVGFVGMRRKPAR